MLACRYIESSLLFFMLLFLEVASARAEEERQKALRNDFAEDLRLDRVSGSFDSLCRWERTMKIQHREWEADKERVVSLFDEKVKILEAREHAILWQERDIVAKEMDLNEREECLLAKERDYNSLLQDVQDDAFRFQKEYRYRHKVIN